LALLPRKRDREERNDKNLVIVNKKGGGIVMPTRGADLYWNALMGGWCQIRGQNSLSRKVKKIKAVGQTKTESTLKKGEGCQVLVF